MVNDKERHKTKDIYTDDFITAVAVVAAQRSRSLSAVCEMG